MIEVIRSDGKSAESAIVSNDECRCRKTKCEYYRDCEACRARHAAKGGLPYCERKKRDKKRKPLLTVALLRGYATIPSGSALTAVNKLVRMVFRCSPMKYLLLSLVLTGPVMLFAVEPDNIADGLAVYRVGVGEPVFLMPYPHASSGVPMAESELAEILIGMDRSVITFDPPGSFRSSRAPEINMEEMLQCTIETLNYFGISGPVDVVGHSMSSFCALAFSVEYQERVKRLMLIGSTSGWPAVRKWSIQEQLKDDRRVYRKFMWWGFRLFTGTGNLAIHKKIDRIIEYASFVDKSHVSAIEIGDNDRKLPAPVRARWPSYLRKENVDYKSRLSTLRIPVLICVGRHDPQTPVIMNQELNDEIADSELVIFEESGHSPFVEEKAKFSRLVRDYLSPSS